MTPVHAATTPADWGHEFETFTIDTTPPRPATGVEEPDLAKCEGPGSGAPGLGPTLNSDDPLLASPNRLVDIKGALAFLSIGRTKLNELLAAGDIPSVHIGRSRLIPVAALEEYVDRLRHQAGCHTDGAS